MNEYKESMKLVYNILLELKQEFVDMRLAIVEMNSIAGQRCDSLDSGVVRLGERVKVLEEAAFKTKENADA